jgi:hypothetical protein
MQGVLKRIALHGLLTAAILAVMGILFTQLATMWLSVSAAPRMTPVEAPVPADPLGQALRYRVPLTMAGFGFAFVAISELLVFALRGEKKPVAATPFVAGDDGAEKLLEELMSQADIALAERNEKPGPPHPNDTPHSASILTPND